LNRNYYHGSSLAEKKKASWIFWYRRDPRWVFSGNDNRCGTSLDVARQIQEGLGSFKWRVSSCPSAVLLELPLMSSLIVDNPCSAIC
jgi:Leu/Phe-tRNA-protein transferase